MRRRRRAILALFESVRGGTYDDVATELKTEFPDDISGNNAQWPIDVSVRCVGRRPARESGSCVLDRVSFA